MLLGAVCASFVPQVQYKQNKRNIPLEKLALGRQPEESEGSELESIASRTV